MKIGAPDFWKSVAEAGSLATTETPVSASSNIADFWKKVSDGGALPVTDTPLGDCGTLPDFWMRVAVAGVVPVTSTLVEFTSEADYWAYVAKNGVVPISAGNVYANARDLWKAIVTGTSGGADSTAPSVASFAATTPNIGGTIAITAFTASEAGVSFLITVSSTPPLSDAVGWSEEAPTTFDATSEGSCTLYPWVKDAAGNVSSVYGAPVAVDVYETPAYANAGGTGDRTASITVTETLAGTGAPSLLVDGNKAANSKFWNNQTASGKVVKFDFGASAKRVITEAKWYQSAAQSQGVWKWQGSNDDSAYTDIGGSFTLGASAATETLTELSGNTTPYRYYRLLGVSGSTSNAQYQREAEFKIGNLVP